MVNFSRNYGTFFLNLNLNLKFELNSNALVSVFRKL
jgi:hypothetical protein